MHLFRFALQPIWIHRCPSCRHRRSIHLIPIRSIHLSFRSCPNGFRRWIRRCPTFHRRTRFVPSRPVPSHPDLSRPNRSCRPTRRSFRHGRCFRCRRYSRDRGFHHRNPIHHPFHRAMIESRRCCRYSHRRTRCFPCCRCCRNFRGHSVLTASRFPTASHCPTASHFRTSIHYRIASRCPIASHRFPSRLIHSCRPIHPSRPEMSLTRLDCFCSGPS